MIAMPDLHPIRSDNFVDRIDSGAKESGMAPAGFEVVSSGTDTVERDGRKLATLTEPRERQGGFRVYMKVSY